MLISQGIRNLTSQWEDYSGMWRLYCADTFLTFLQDFQNGIGVRVSRAAVPQRCGNSRSFLPLASHCFYFKKSAAQHLQFSANPQSFDPKYPTVVPALDFDPDKDAARIETAIKTKGKLHRHNTWTKILGCGTSLCRWVAGICESASWLRVFRPCWEGLQRLCWQSWALAADWELLATVWPLTLVPKSHVLRTEECFCIREDAISD